VDYMRDGKRTGYSPPRAVDAERSVVAARFGETWQNFNLALRLHHRRKTQGIEGEDAAKRDGSGRSPGRVDVFGSDVAGLERNLIKF